MKKIIIFTIALFGLLVVLVVLKSASSESTMEATPMAEEDTHEHGPDGIVSRVGDGEFEFTDHHGHSVTVRMPADRTTCVAKESIADPNVIAVGDEVFVNAAVDANGHLVPCDRVEDYLWVNSVFKNSEVGYSFVYPKDVQIFANSADGTLTNPEPTFVGGVRLAERTELAALATSTEGREGPPAIHIMAYKNPTQLWPLMWAKAFPQESNIALALDEPAESDLAGAPTIRYTADGLYAADTYVAASGDYMIVVRAEYIDQDSPIYGAFETIYNSFTLAPSAE